MKHVFIGGIALILLMGMGDAYLKHQQDAYLEQTSFIKRALFYRSIFSDLDGPVFVSFLETKHISYVNRCKALIAEKNKVVDYDLYDAVIQTFPDYTQVTFITEIKTSFEENIPPVLGTCEFNMVTKEEAVAFGETALPGETKYYKELYLKKKRSKKYTE